jgi:hypothetical protein
MKKGANKMNRTFSKEEVQMSKKHMKKFSKSLAIKGNANQNHLKISPHSCLNDYHQEHKQTSHDILKKS